MDARCTTLRDELRQEQVAHREAADLADRREDETTGAHDAKAVAERGWEARKQSLLSELEAAKAATKQASDGMAALEAKLDDTRTKHDQEISALQDRLRKASAEGGESMKELQAALSAAEESIKTSEAQADKSESQLSDLQAQLDASREYAR